MSLARRTYNDSSLAHDRVWRWCASSRYPIRGRCAAGCCHESVKVADRWLSRVVTFESTYCVTETLAPSSQPWTLKMPQKVELVVFLALVLDLLGECLHMRPAFPTTLNSTCRHPAFTIPLPLFPRIIEWYTSREASNPYGLLSRTLSAVRLVRATFLTVDVGDSTRRRWDIILLGVCRLFNFDVINFPEAYNILGLDGLFIFVRPGRNKMDFDMFI
jgi:hypothetical protein